MSLATIGRRIVYSLVVCGSILFVVNRAAQFLEHRGWISLDTPDTIVTYVSNSPYTREGESYVTDPSMQDVMVQTRFRAVKREAWRMFVLGESFAMGSPYVKQRRAKAGDGGISSWLTADLQALFPSSPIEIINAAAGGQNSNRVRQIGELVMQFEPNAVLIAACNNEGVLPPGRVNEILHTTGAYRLLSKLTAPDVPREKRSYFTPQDPDADAIRTAFENNLRTLLEAAHAHHVDVLLCTMPVNLRYAGTEPGHPLKEGDAVPPELAPNDCTIRATERFDAGDAKGAIEILRGCDTDLEGLRKLGLALFAARQFGEAHSMLSIYTELAPRNRCRPSLNRVIREQAQKLPWIHLVDLEAAAESLSPGGIPGEELFLDYCHMNWAGYAAMADVVRQAILDAGIGPAASPQPNRLPSRALLAKHFGLPEDPREFLQ